MPSFRTKLVTRKKKAVRKASKTFRHNKKLRKNISAKKIYTKGKQFRRVARGFVKDLRESVMKAKELEELEAKKLEEEENVCAICFEHISPSTALKLKCGHTFHKDCIKQSLRRGNFSCPLCRGVSSYPWVKDIARDAKEMLDNAKKQVEAAEKILAMYTEAHKKSVIELDAANAEKETADILYKEAVAANSSRASVLAAEKAEKAVEKAEKKVENAEATVKKNNDYMQEATVIMNEKTDELKAVEARVDEEIEVAIDSMSYGAEEREAARWAEMEAADAKIDEDAVARAEAAGAEAARARQEAMASEEAARTEATRVRIVNAARASMQAERAAASAETRGATRGATVRIVEPAQVSWREALVAANSGYPNSRMRL